jgi:hypothetical protein
MKLQVKSMCLIMLSLILNHIKGPLSVVLTCEEDPRKFDGQRESSLGYSPRYITRDVVYELKVTSRTLLSQTHTKVESPDNYIGNNIVSRLYSERSPRQLRTIWSKKLSVRLL